MAVISSIFRFPRCTEIAKKLGVSLNTVKSWKKRYGDTQKGAPKKRTPPHPKGASSKCTQKAPQDGKTKLGAPLGNVNAVGNHGGAPPGNQNALKHGGWSAVMFGAFSEENQKAIQDCTKDVDAEDKLHGSLGCGADSPRLSIVTSAMCDTI